MRPCDEAGRFLPARSPFDRPLHAPQRHGHDRHGAGPRLLEALRLGVPGGEGQGDKHLATEDLHALGSNLWEGTDDRDGAPRRHRSSFRVRVAAGDWSYGAT